MANELPVLVFVVSRACAGFGVLLQTLCFYILSWLQSEVLYQKHQVPLIPGKKIMEVVAAAIPISTLIFRLWL